MNVFEDLGMSDVSKGLSPILAVRKGKPQWLSRRASPCLKQIDIVLQSASHRETNPHNFSTHVEYEPEIQPKEKVNPPNLQANLEDDQRTS